MNYTTRTLRIYIQHAIKFPGMLTLVIIGILITVGADISMPFALRNLFNLLMLEGPHPLGITIMLVLGLRILSSFGQRLLYWADTMLLNPVMVALTQESFRYLHRHSSRFFANMFSGSLVKRLNRFTVGFEVTTDQAFMDLGQQSLRLLCIVVALTMFSKLFGLISISWLVIVVYANIVHSQNKIVHDIKRSQCDSAQTAVLSDTIGNTGTIQLFANLDHEIAKFKKVSQALADIRIKCWMMGMRFDIIQSVLMILLESAFYLFAIHNWRLGKITIGDFVLLQTFIGQIFYQSSTIGRNIRRQYEVFADANEMTEVLEMKHEIVDIPDAVELKVRKMDGGCICFENVCFEYIEDRPVFTGLNLTVRPGERVAFVGPSGGGKSTVTKLLLRQFNLKSGRISIDGQDISEVTQDSLRRNIAVVPQDSNLFHISLWDNIHYGRLSATEEEVLTASRLAHAHDFILQQKDGYDSMVGERGIKLSGGQRQRITIARAILSDAAILILDEATSALDSKSEQAIQNALENLMADKTVLVIAHRLSTIRKMHRIVVINEEGEITEEGTHEELLRMDGHYRELWEIQAGESQISTFDALPV